MCIVSHWIVSQLSGHCDIISNRLWHHQQNENQVGETWERCVKIVVLSLFMDLICHVRNKVIYVLLWQTVSVLTRVLFWCLFPLLPCKEINPKITLSRELKQFATWVHTLFSTRIKCCYTSYAKLTQLFTDFLVANAQKSNNGTAPYNLFTKRALTS